MSSRSGQSDNDPWGSEEISERIGFKLATQEEGISLFEDSIDFLQSGEELLNLFSIANANGFFAACNQKELVIDKLKKLKSPEGKEFGRIGQLEGVTQIYFNCDETLLFILQKGVIKYLNVLNYFETGDSTIELLQESASLTDLKSISPSPADPKTICALSASDDLIIIRPTGTIAIALKISVFSWSFMGNQLYYSDGIDINAIEPTNVNKVIFNVPGSSNTTEDFSIEENKIIFLSELTPKSLFVVYDKRDATVDDHEIRSFIVKKSTSTYEWFDSEIAPAYGSAERIPNYYLEPLFDWNQRNFLYLITSGLATDIGIMRCNRSYIHIIAQSEDTDRAQYPIDDVSGDDYSSIGFGIDMSSTPAKSNLSDFDLEEPIFSIEETSDNLPCAWSLCHTGKLVGWWIFNKDLMKAEPLIAGIIDELKEVNTDSKSSTNDEVNQGTLADDDFLNSSMNSFGIEAKDSTSQPSGLDKSANNTSSLGGNAFGAKTGTFGNITSEASKENPTATNANSVSSGFGQTGFGTSSNPTSGFGQTGFGKPGVESDPKTATSGFGQTGFGNTSSSGFGLSGFGQTGFGKSGIGASSTPSSGFGQSSFGQSSFGQSSFGKASPTTNSSSSSAFGQSGFGTGTTSTGFGKSTFGSNTKPSSGFGSGSGFGNLGTTAEKSSPFDKLPESNKSPFANVAEKSTSIFGSDSIKSGGSPFSVNTQTKPETSKLESPFAKLGAQTNKETESKQSKVSDSPFSTLFNKGAGNGSDKPKSDSPFANLGANQAKADSPFTNLFEKKNDGTNSTNIFDSPFSNLSINAKTKSENSTGSDETISEKASPEIITSEEEEINTSEEEEINTSEEEDINTSDADEIAKSEEENEVANASEVVNGPIVHEDKPKEVGPKEDNGNVAPEESGENKLKDEESKDEVIEDEKHEEVNSKENEDETPKNEESKDEVTKDREHKEVESKVEPPKEKSKEDESPKEVPQEAPKNEPQEESHNDETSKEQPEIAEVNHNKEKDTSKAVEAEEPNVDSEEQAESDSESDEIYQNADTKANNQSESILSESESSEDEDVYLMLQKHAPPSTAPDYYIYAGFSSPLKKSNDPIHAKIQEIYNDTEGYLTILDKNANALISYIDEHGIEISPPDMDEALQYSSLWHLSMAKHLNSVLSNLSPDIKHILDSSRDQESKLRELGKTIEKTQVLKIVIDKLLSQLSLLSDSSSLSTSKDRSLDLQNELLQTSVRQKLNKVRKLENELIAKLMPFKAKLANNDNMVHNLEKVIYQINTTLHHKVDSVDKLTKEIDQLSIKNEPSSSLILHESSKSDMSSSTKWNLGALYDLKQVIPRKVSL